MFKAKLNTRLKKSEGRKYLLFLVCLKSPEVGFKSHIMEYVRGLDIILDLLNKNVFLLVLGAFRRHVVETCRTHNRCIITN